MRITFGEPKSVAGCSYITTVLVYYSINWGTNMNLTPLASSRGPASTSAAIVCDGCHGGKQHRA